MLRNSISRYYYWYKPRPYRHIPFAAPAGVSAVDVPVAAAVPATAAAVPATNTTA